MRIIAKKTLREFWELYPDAEESLLAWYREVKKEDWSKPSQVNDKYRTASFVGDRVVFNIKGNDYRLVVKINLSVWSGLCAFCRDARRIR